MLYRNIKLTVFLKKLIYEDNNYFFQEIVHHIKKLTFGPQKLKTNGKKKIEIKREKRLVQPKFCKFKGGLDCLRVMSFLKLHTQ